MIAMAAELYRDPDLEWLDHANRVGPVVAPRLLKELGLSPTNADPCVYTMKEKGEIAIVVIYVDDVIVATKRADIRERIKNGLSTEFEMKDLGRIEHCLGMEITQDLDKGEVSISQHRLIVDTLKKFGMADCKPAKTQMEAGLKLEKPADYQ